MGKKEIRASLVIDAEVKAAEQAFDKLSAKTKDLWGDASIPKSTLTSIEKLREKIVALRSASDSGDMFNEEEVKQIKKECDQLKKTIYDLTLNFKLLSKEQKRALVGDDAEKVMESRANAVDKYEKAVKKAVETEKTRLDLEKKLAAEQKKQKDLKAPELSNNGKKVKRMHEIEAELGKKRLTKNQKFSLENEYFNLNIDTEGIKKGEEEFAAWTEQMKEFDRVSKNTEEQITSLKNQLDNLSPKTQEQAFEDLKKELKGLGVEGIDSVKSLKDIKDILDSLDNQALAGVQEKLDGLTGLMTDLGNAANEAGEKIEGTTDQIVASNKAAADQDAFESRIKSFLGMAGAAEVLRNAVRNAFQTIKELDATMTEMAVVTDLTVGDYWDQLPEYSARARELGISINDAYKAATLYYQQGLESNEVTAISAQTLKMARIAGLDAADATDKMTAALRGFNMELNEASAQKVADVYSQLAAITASDVEEISSAMTKTASIASSAGMDFETTSAFLAQIIETTRESAETAGTAMKTIIARFQELKKAPGEIGEVDGEIVDANKIEGALRSVGVSLRDASGQFRDLDEVFLELSGKWDSLDKNTQRYIATIAAGSRQQSRFIAMMSDYGRTTELVQAANSSAGASQAQFNKTLDSLETKLANLTTAWEEFSMGIMNSDLVKTGVDILTKFLNILNKATGQLEGFWNSASKVASIVVIFSLAKAAFNKLRGSLKSFFVEVVADAREAGIQSGTAYAKGSREGAETEKKTFGQAAFGTDHFKAGTEGLKKSWNNRAERKATKAKIKEDKALLANMKKDGSGGSAEESAAVFIEAELDSLQKKQKTFKEESKKAWKEVGAGISQTGQSLAVVGVSMSMIGGYLSELGLDTLGDTLSGVGQVITIIGSALMAIPPILTLISSHPIIAVVTIALGIILVAITAIYKKLKEKTAAAKLERLQEMSEGLSDAANRASEAFSNLNSTLDGLKGQYENLKNLKKGTSEWYEEVFNINEQVNQLLEKFPELKDAVYIEDGVLKINYDSDSVDKAIASAQRSTIVSRIMSQSAETAIAATRVKALEEEKTKHENAAKNWRTWGTLLALPLGQVGYESKELLAKAEDEKARLVEKDITSAKQAQTLSEAKELEGYRANIALLGGSELTGEENTMAASIFTDSFAKAFKENYKFEGTDNEKLLARAEAIKTVYGQGAYYKESDETIYDQAGNKLGTIRKEEMDAFIDEYAAAGAGAELYKQLPKVAKELGNVGTALFGKGGGGNLTQEDINKLTEDAKKTLWKDLSETAKDLFGSEEVFNQVIDEVKEEGQKKLDNLTKHGASGNFTAETAEKLGGNLEKVVVAGEKIEQVMAKFSEDSELSQEAKDRIAQADWGNMESLLALQGDLQHEFGWSAEAAKEYVDAIAATTGAANEAKYSINAYGDFYKAIENIEQAMERATKKAWEFNRALEGKGGDVPQLAQDQIAEYQSVANRAKKAYDDATQNLFNTYWEGADPSVYGADLTQYIKLGANGIDMENSQLELAKAKVGEENFQKYIDEINKYYADRKTTEDNWKQAIEGIESINQQGEDTYYELRDLVKETLVGALQEQIDLQQQNLDATKQANDVLVSKIQEQIDYERQQEQNEENEQELSDLYSQQAFLLAQGGNESTLAQLEKEISEKEQDYLGLLTDQTIAEMQKANNLAYDQRQQQITLAQQSLDAYQTSAEFQQQVDYQLQELFEQEENWQDSAFGQALSKTLGKDGMTAGEWVNMASEISSQIGLANIWGTEGQTWSSIASAILSRYQADTDGGDPSALTDEQKAALIEANSATRTSAIATAAEEMVANPTGYKTSEKYTNALSAYENAYSPEAGETKPTSSDFYSSVSSQAREPMIEKMVGFGISEDTAQNIYDEGNFTKFFSLEQNAPDNDNLITQLDQLGTSYLSIDDYYKNVSDWNDVVSYTDYLVALKSARNYYKAVNPESVKIRGFDDDEGTWFDLKIGNIWNEWVQTGTKLIGRKTRLDNAYRAHGRPPVSGSLLLYENGNKLYIRGASEWYPVEKQSKSIMTSKDFIAQEMVNLISRAKSNLIPFKTGGLADFTGPAWLDGTKSKPEIVLNQRDTANFLQLRDILSEVMESSKHDSSSKKTGDNYFEIEINVDKLENDYDVEKIATKIRSMLYEDATYRNVNAINSIR